MAIVTLTSNESGANSLIDINANFVDLDTTKADLASPAFTGTPSLPTGTTAVTQTANDNSTKVATTAYVDGAVSASNSALTILPLPHGFDGTTISQPNITGDTTAFLGQVIIPFNITANKVSFWVNGVTAAGTFDISLYSEDGQTQLFSVTTATVSGAGVVTTALSSVAITPGIYYIMINTNSTTNIIVPVWNTSAEPFTTSGGLMGDVTSEPVMRGTLTISAGTPPATFTPASITDAANSTLIFRLDN